MAADAGAFFDYLAARPEVSGDAFGTTGYCMGGRTSLVVAGRVPQRVAAAMSFHGGGLATDDPGSPHLLADQIKAAVYVGGAENDASFTTEQAETLDKALTAAGRRAHHRVLPGGPRIRGARQRRRTTTRPPQRHWDAHESRSSARPGLTRRNARHRVPVRDHELMDDQATAEHSDPGDADRASTRYSPAVGCWSTARSTTASHRRPHRAPTSSCSTSRTRSPRRTSWPPATT